MHSGMEWFCLHTVTSTADTSDIEADSTQANTAADYAANLTEGGKSDWFLGSLGEMKLMYDNLQGVGGFVESIYWSSSEANADYAWGQDFLSGIQYTFDKTNTYYVRPVRAF